MLYGVPDGSSIRQKEPTARPRREIDRRSSIRIEYDRGEVERLGGLEVQIEGAVKGDKEPRKIEIPGYSLVGEKTSRARVAYVGEFRFLGMTTMLQLHVKKTLDQFTKVAASLDSAQAKALTALYRQQIDAHISRDSLRLRAQSAERKFQLTRSAMASVVDSGPGSLSASLQSAWSADSINWSTTREALAKAEATAQSSDSAFNAHVNGTIGSETARTQVDSLSRVFLDDVVLRDMYTQFGDTSSEPIEDLIAQSGVVSLTVWRGMISRLLAGYVTLAQPSHLVDVDSVYARRRLLFRMRDEMLETSGLLRGIEAPALKEALAASLRETSFTVSGTGAQVNEDIVLTLRSLVDGAQKREVNVLLTVSEHGIVSRITDSFLFLRRRGIANDEGKRVAQRLLEFQNASDIARQLLPTTVDVPLEENFTATPGVNFGWVYSPADDAQGFQYFLRAMKPGWGLNASFPSFSTKQIRIKPSDTATVEAQTVDKQSLGLSTGLYLSLFDGAISYSHGWNLTVPEKRQYDGVGLSFVGLAKQGRELFEKFQHH